MIRAAAREAPADLRQRNRSMARPSGILGFGHHRRLHHKGLLGVSDDRPVTIMAVDDERKIRAVLPELREMVKEGLILLLDAELIADQPPRP
jgi:PII-like signaling protein